MNRRRAITTGGMALLGLGLGGCATGGRSRGAQSRLNLAPVRASWDRIIRTTVGLRPHRPAGFNLSVAKIDDKTVIHNYGHGGSGHSLGWGTGFLAADLAVAHDMRRAAVIGCGTVGLTAARQLQRRGFDVTIYAASVPPDTTSNMALAAFTPTSGLFSTEIAPAWIAQFQRAAEISYRQLQLLVGSNYGVSWIDSYGVSDSAPGAAGDGGRVGGGGGSVGGGGGAGGASESLLLPAGVQQSTGREIFGPGQHPFPAAYAIRRHNLRIEPSIYLDALVRDFLRFGGRLVIRRFDTPRDLMTLDESLIVNCSGLGARTLFDDATMMPVKGQLVLLVPQPEVTYQCRVMPRSDGIALGSTMERGVETLEPNEAERTRVVEAAIKFYNAMRPSRPGAALTRSSSPTSTPSIASFLDEPS